MTDTIVLVRESLRLGKYTSGYAELSAEQLEGPLWLLGEWSIRVRTDGTLGANKRRAQAALDALRTFHRRPLTREQVRSLMCYAAAGRRPPEADAPFGDEYAANAGDES